MGTNAKITAGFIELDTHAWIAQRTGGWLEDMSAHCADFCADLTQRIRPTLRGITPRQMIEVFIIARTGLDWADAQNCSLIQLHTHHALALSHAIAVHRYIDPEYGHLAIAAPTGGEYLTTQPLAYVDATATPEDWTTLAARISCPQGHQFRYTGTHISADGYPPRPIGDVFPDARIVTTGDHLTAGSWRISCPSCAAHCDVDLADSTHPEDHTHPAALALSAR